MPVSVVVTAYNIESYIDRALASILDQGFPDTEIIVVDDGSSDTTLTRVARLLKGEPRAQIIAQANAGPGAARNAGLRAARGEYVAFLDGDDWFAPHALATLYDAADGVDVVFSNRSRYWERSGRYKPDISFGDRRGVDVTEAPEILKIMAIHGKLFRRRFLVDNEITFPERMSSEDFAFTYRTYAHLGTLTTIPDVTYIYRKRADALNRSLTQERLSEFNLSSRLRQIEMTVDIVKNSDLTEKFPGVNFLRIDYDTRLMRHIVRLPAEQDAAQRQRAMDQIREFLVRHRDEVLPVVRPTTRPIYEALIAGDFAEAIRRIEANLGPSKAAA